MFSQYLSQYLNGVKMKAPADFVINHLVGSFAETVKWWIDNRMKYTPEETARYYIEVSFIDRIIPDQYVLNSTNKNKGLPTQGAQNYSGRISRRFMLQ